MKIVCCLRRRGRRVDVSYIFYFRENIGRIIVLFFIKMEKVFFGELGIVLVFLEFEFK